MKLFYMPGACSLSDHIALEWAGADYQLQQVPRDQLKSPDYLAVNPAGAVPALEVEPGWVLTENVAILQLVAQRYPGAELGGRDERERLEVLRWTANLASDVHKAFLPLFAPQRFVEGEEATAVLQRKAVENVRAQLRRIEQALTGKAFLAGERRSVADAYLYVILRWAAGKAGGLEAFPQLQRFKAAMEQDPAVQRALAAEGLA
jgi:glutathione S-transferase